MAHRHWGPSQAPREDQLQLGTPGPARVTEPLQPLHPFSRPQVTSKTALSPSLLGAGGWGARRRVIFSRDLRKALFSSTFTGHHSLNPEPGLRRPAGKPPLLGRGNRCVLPCSSFSGGPERQAGVGLHGWGGSTDGEVPPHSWSVRLINLESKGDVESGSSALGTGAKGSTPLLSGTCGSFHRG